MYDRTVKPIPEPHTTGFRYRIETLVGITGTKMARYRVSWTESILSPINVVWRPHLLGILLFEGILFGFGIGINVRCSPLSLQTVLTVFSFRSRMQCSWEALIQLGLGGARTLSLEHTVRRS